MTGRDHSCATEEEVEQARRNALDIIEEVGRRGIFQTRRPEGKAGDH